MPAGTIGIIGAGAAGSGTAQLSAIAGFDVILVDVSDAAASKGIAKITDSLRRRVARGTITAAEKELVVARIMPSTAYQPHVAGFSRLTGADEEGTVARLRALRHELIDPVVAANGGRLVKNHRRRRVDRVQQRRGRCSLRDRSAEQDGGAKYRCHT